MDNLNKEKHIFANLFLLANKLQILGDSYLSKDGITIKQWFLILTISQFSKESPMLTEVANLMGTSRQNVKKLALILQEKGFLNIEKDAKDSRALRLSLTEKNQCFWENRQEKDDTFMYNLFKSLSTEEINITYNSLNKLLDEIEENISDKPENL